MTAPGGGRFPVELEAWIRRHAGTEPEAAGKALLAGAGEALEAALRRPGRDREGARALLAADALLTGACEEAAGDADPEAQLLALLQRLRRREAE